MKHIFLSLFVFVSSIIYSQKLSDKALRIDSVINSNFQRNIFSGSVLVAQKGEIVFKKSYGLANQEWNIQNTADTKFRIGSVSKQFTAMLVMQLYQAGKISLQANIKTYLPWFDEGAGRKITVHHLLSNTSGLPNYTDFPDFLSQTAVKQFDPLTFAKAYFKTSLDFEPGTKYFYSNTNYFLLGLIIESVTGKSYEQVLRENILEPAKMNNSGIDYPDKIIRKRANGYVFTFDGYVNSGYINMASSTFACGALFSTVDDLYLWDRALNTISLLSDENKKLMFTPNLDNYAYGWIVRNIKDFMKTGRNVTLQVHGGRINGFLALVCRIPEEDIFITFLNNTRVANHSDVLDNMLNNVVSVLHGQPYSLSKPTPVYEMEKMMKDKPASEAVAYYKQLKKSQKTKFDFGDSADLTNLADYWLEKGRTRDALEIYKLNADENPDSAAAVQIYIRKLYEQNAVKEANDYLEKSRLSNDIKDKINQLIRNK